MQRLVRAATVAGVVLSASMATGQPFERRIVIETLTQPGGAPGTPQEAALTVPVQFELGSDRLTADSARILDIVASAMNDPQLIARTFVVEGHTDSRGGDGYNLNLSKGRAKTVREYLVAKGVAGGRLTAAGYGESRPLPGIASTDGRNRRVVVVREF